MAVQKSRKTPSKRGMHRSHARLKNPAPLHYARRFLPRAPRD